MSTKKIISYLIITFLSLSVYADIKDDNKEEVNNYVHQLIKDGLEVFNDQSLDKNTKITKTKKMILANLDLNWMAKFTLGVYRKTLTPEQTAQFTEQYGEYVSKAYADLVKNYTGQLPTLKQVREISEKEFMVETLIGNTKVNYLVRQVKDENNNTVLKVSDVITEGVSLVNSQQAEFMNILSNSNFDTLLDELRKKS